MVDEIKSLQKILDDFGELKIKERTGTTLLEIARCPHLENVWTNVLAFYLNPNNEHKLYDLILKSMFTAAKKDVPIINYSNISVWTQYQTEIGNYMDIVVSADNFILGIENKVGADLYNDLRDYSKTIDDLAKGQSLPSFKIVLSKFQTPTSNGFDNVTYSELIKTIRGNMGDYTDYADTKYLIFLLDFLKNIENNINSLGMSDNLEVINFLKNNKEKISKLLDYHNKFNADLIRKLDNIDRCFNRENIKELLSSIGKPYNFHGTAANRISGRFTYQGAQLIKYNLIINDIYLLYQVAIQDYELVSWYWFDNNKYQYLERKLEEKGIKSAKYNFDESNEDIAMKIEEQIKQIIRVLGDEA